MDALIMRLLAKDPSERPATDVLSALDAIHITTSVERPAAPVDEAHALYSLAYYALVTAKVARITGVDGLPRGRPGLLRLR